MKVFISQSKPRSLALAQTLESFIRKVVPGTDPGCPTRQTQASTRVLSSWR